MDWLTTDSMASARLISELRNALSTFLISTRRCWPAGRCSSSSSVVFFISIDFPREHCFSPFASFSQKEVDSSGVDPVTGGVTGWPVTVTDASLSKYMEALDDPMAVSKFLAV